MCDFLLICEYFAFFFLSERDLNHFLGNWSVPNLNEIVDLFELFLNPDKCNESDSDLMRASPCWEYYSINRIYNKILDRDWFSTRLFVT